MTTRNPNGVEVFSFAAPPKVVIKRSVAPMPLPSGIRVATPDMLEAVSEACMRAFGTALTRLSPIEPAHWVADLRMMLSHPDRRIIVAIDDGKIIGCHAIGVHRAPYASDASSSLSLGLWVAPEFRTLGIEVQLLAAGEEWARARGANHIVAIMYVPAEPKRGKRRLVAELKRQSEMYEQGGFGLVEMRVAKRLK